MSEGNTCFNPPVNMIPYSEKALLSLRAELLTSEIVGKDHVYNVAASFDTEASSFEDNDCNPVGLCYIWMFGIRDTVVYGRDLDEFVALVTNIQEFLEWHDARLYVYVHFLKYDFAFIQKYFKWDEVFCREPRYPLFAKLGRIEFRDSLALSGGRGLAYIGEKVLRKKMKKAVGDLDYEKIRTPETPMTQLELHYCEMDIRVLNQYITEKIEDDGDIKKIPLTNTGYVRKYVRDKCFEHRGRYMDLVDGLTMTPDAYLQMEWAFAGGAVGPNIKHIREICENVHSYDIKSSYPYVMCACYFPMGYFTPVQKVGVQGLEALVTNNCVQFTLEVFSLWPRTNYCFPISESKCKEVIGARTASGRVISAAYVKINVTELDWLTIKEFYDLDSADDIRISRVRIAPRGYLPDPIVKSVLKFFYDKTTLDGVEDKKAEYMIAKNMLNSVYGMMVERIVRNEILFHNGFSKGQKDYIKQVVEYNEKRNRFLYYPWGVWVTAHARRRLYEAIAAVGDDYRYCDTDCVKFVGNHQAYFAAANVAARNEMLKTAKRLHLAPEQVMPSDPKGNRKCLGVWEHEAEYKRFKTIGAKRYLCETDKGKLELTVAGTNKKGTLEYMKKRASQLAVDIFDLFDENLVIPAEYAKRTVAKFQDVERSGWIKDYTGVKRYYCSPSGVNITPTSYSFSITEEMKDAMLWLLNEGHYTESEI